MSEEIFVQFGSPTLAGIKTGNLFTCPYTDRRETMQEIRKLNKKLAPKGLRVLPLRYSSERVLLYLYRPARLEKDLSNKEAMELLKKAGYRHENANQCVVELIHRLNDLKSEFPHEIGLFLGYPPEDVRSFMEDSRRGVKCTGCWKAYGNEEEAEKTFSKFRKCTALYRRELSRGKSLAQLAVRTRNCGGRDYYNEKKGKNSYE